MQCMRSIGNSLYLPFGRTFMCSKDINSSCWKTWFHSMPIHSNIVNYLSNANYFSFSLYCLFFLFSSKSKMCVFAAPILTTPIKSITFWTVDIFSPLICNIRSPTQNSVILSFSISATCTVCFSSHTASLRPRGWEVFCTFIVMILESFSAGELMFVNGGFRYTSLHMCQSRTS